MSLTAPLSVGQLADEVTILRLKVERLDWRKREAARRELESKSPLLGTLNVPQEMIEKLMRINGQLWHLEDARRQHMCGCYFGAEAMAVCNEITRLNDERARVKREINEVTHSEIVEVKGHAGA